MADDLDATQDDLLAEKTDNGPEDGAETPSQDPNWDPNDGALLDGEAV